MPTFLSLGSLVAASRRRRPLGPRPQFTPRRLDSINPRRAAPHLYYIGQEVKEEARAPSAFVFFMERWGFPALPSERWATCFFGLFDMELSIRVNVFKAFPATGDRLKVADSDTASFYLSTEMILSAVATRAPVQQLGPSQSRPQGQLEVVQIRRGVVFKHVA